jgi:hypothetical protein
MRHRGRPIHRSSRGALLVRASGRVAPRRRHGDAAAPALADRARRARRAACAPHAGSHRSRPRRTCPTASPGLSPTLTPVDRFFRIDTAITIPRVDARAWRLRVHGLVTAGGRARPRRARRPRARGARRDDLLRVQRGRWRTRRDGPLDRRAARCACSRSQVRCPTPTSSSAGPSTAGPRVPDGARVGPDVLVAIGMNGVELPAASRLPGAAHRAGALRLRVRDEVAERARADALGRLRRLLDPARLGEARPGEDDGAHRRARARVVVPGTVRVAGVAWAPVRGVAGSNCASTRPVAGRHLLGPARRRVWRQWWLDVELAAGEHELQVRAIDGTGRCSPRARGRAAGRRRGLAPRARPRPRLTGRAVSPDPSPAVRPPNPPRPCARPRTPPLLSRRRRSPTPAGALPEP